jgi:hypothetical protein
MRARGSTVRFASSAELFFEDLAGESAPPLREPADRGVGAEPFFDDEPDHRWKVVARPGSSIRRLRPDDVIVRRSGADGRAWQCVLAEDAQPRSLYQGRRRSVLRDDVVVLRRVRRRPQPPAEAEDFNEIVEVCGFFGPNNVRRTEQQIRDAVVSRANAEWTAWHTSAGAARLEGDAGMFGRLVGYYLAASRNILPDTLTSVQAAALGAINYGPLLAAGASAATITAEVTRIRGLLLAGAPGATATGLSTLVDNAIRHAREAHAHAGPFKAWSAAFVSACVRGAGITERLEGVIPPGRTHVGRDELLRPSLMHAAYTVEARGRRAATTPRRRGTYHAFTPAERAPQLGDIIVQDRRAGITAAQVTTLATLTAGVITHGDIVVEVDPAFVVTIGGNVGDSARKRRFPRDAQGLLVINAQQLYTQENNAGALPALPAQSTSPLAGRSTARIFAVLSPIEECAAVPGQPHGGGVLT